MKHYTQQEVEKNLIAITMQLLAESGEPHHREINMQVSIARHLGIDSLGRAELFSRIEKTFDVSIPDRVLAEAETLQDILAYIQEAKPGMVRLSPHERISSHGGYVHLDLSHAHTLIEVLESYAHKSPDKPHIFFQNEDGREEIITYGHLYHAALRVASGLRARGLVDGDAIAIMQPTTPGFFYTFFGVMLAGCLPVPIYPPFRMHMLEAYAKTEAKILRNAEVRALVTFQQAENLSLLLKSFVPSLQHVTTVTELMQHDVLRDVRFAKSNAPAFIQYTSGSTADPKGVLLSHHNLITNIHAYGQAIKVRENDVAVSWLPLYHDMGLIGMWLGSLYYGIPLILMTPFSFLNRPEKWLWAIHYHRGTLSGAPNFAYELCVRKIDPGTIEGLDLSSWRMAANGAEKIYPRTLDAFSKKFAPYGFNRKALLPVYGLAESTVALTIPSVDEVYRLDQIDRKAFEEENHAIPMHDENNLTFVSCGKPIENHSIRVVNGNFEVLPERHVGRLQFQGPSMMQGYFNNPVATNAILHDGWMDTGDLAYIADGECFITGRRKDLIIKAGRNLYPAEIEEYVERVPGVRQGCVAAFEVSDVKHGTGQLVIVAESREKDQSKKELIVAAIKDVIASALDVVPDHVVIVAPRIVPKTSSGKLQRAACKKLFIENKLGKPQSPAWLQMSSLGLQALVRSAWQGVKWIGKLCFTIYAGMLFLLTAPFVFLYVRKATRDNAAIACKNWARLMLFMGGCRLRVIGRDKLTMHTPVVYASNHASYIDSLVMIAILPIQTRIVFKKELMNSAFFRVVMTKLDHLAVDRLDLSRGLDDTKSFSQTLRSGLPILIFPEGTFGYSVGLRPFKLGAFKIATENHTPVCPIALQGTRNLLRNDEKLMCPSRITVTVSDPIFPGENEWKEVTELRQKVRLAIAAHCGEPSLDLIAAGAVAEKPPGEKE